MDAQVPSLQVQRVSEGWQLLPEEEEHPWPRVLHCWRCAGAGAEDHEARDDVLPPGVAEAVRQAGADRVLLRATGDHTSAPQVVLGLACPRERQPWEVGGRVWVLSTARVVEAYVAPPPPSPAFAGSRREEAASCWRYVGSGKGVPFASDEAAPAAVHGTQEQQYVARVDLPPQRTPCTELNLKFCGVGRKGRLAVGAIVVAVRPHRADPTPAGDIVDMGAVADLVSGISGYQPPPGLPPPSALASLSASHLFQMLAAPSSRSSPASVNPPSPSPSLGSSAMPMLFSALVSTSRSLDPSGPPGPPPAPATAPQATLSILPGMEAGGAGGMAMVGLMKAYVDSALQQLEQRLIRRVDDMEGRLNSRLDVLLSAVVASTTTVTATEDASTQRGGGPAVRQEAKEEEEHDGTRGAEAS